MVDSLQISQFHALSALRNMRITSVISIYCNQRSAVRVVIASCLTFIRLRIRLMAFEEHMSPTNAVPDNSLSYSCCDSSKSVSSIPCSFSVSVGVLFTSLPQGTQTSGSCSSAFATLQWTSGGCSSLFITSYGYV